MDTIAAIATAPGSGGLAVIRISGDDAIAVASRVFKGKTPLAPEEDHKVLYGFCRRPDGEKIDECMATVFVKPRSFTGENTVELSCHGGTLVAGAVLSALFAAGARLAEPGEFTMRAFLNGRIDLTQAEAVNDIIQAKTKAGLSGAVNQLGGSLSKKINALRNQAVSVAAALGVSTDFPEEDVESLTGIALEEELSTLIAELEALLKTADTGRILKEGVLCAIVGRPNTGKSSLLNLLAGEDRAIVTDIAGTTRDVIEEFITVGNVPLRLADTAGIRETEDIVEKIGVDKTKEYIAQSELCLLMLDNTGPLTDEDKEILALLAGKPHIVLLNKADCAQVLYETDFEAPAILFSAKTGMGLDRLEEEVARLVLHEALSPHTAMLTNTRQKDALMRALTACRHALDSHRAGLFEDMIYIDLEHTISALGEITGMTVSDEIVHNIFSQFCLGK